MDIRTTTRVLKVPSSSRTALKEFGDVTPNRSPAALGDKDVPSAGIENALSAMDVDEFGFEESELLMSAQRDPTLAEQLVEEGEKNVGKC
jgi:hypothetical protein